MSLNKDKAMSTGPPSKYVHLVEEALIKVEKNFDEYLEGHSNFRRQYLEDQLSKLEEELAGTKAKATRALLQKDIDDKQWVLDNREMLARRERALIYHTILVHSLKKTKKGWFCQLWVSPTEKVVLELEDDYVEYHLLSESTFQDHRRFRNGGFVPLQKYDRQQTVDDTEFRSIERSKTNGILNFVVTDIFGHQVPVSKKWAKNNISVEAFANLMDFGYSPLGLGCAALPRKDETVQGVGSATVTDQSFPLIAFRHGTKERKCLQLAFANGLHFLGYQNEAGILANSSIPCSKQLEACLGLVKQMMSPHGFSRIPVAWRANDKRYDPLNPDHHSEKSLVVGSLKAAIGGKPVGINHAVAFIGGFVLDCNRERALPISQESLDLICNDIKDGATYTGLFFTRELKKVGTNLKKPRG